MAKPDCSSFKNALLSHLEEEISSRSVSGDCIVTVPLQTVDGRYVDVTVEDKGNGFYLVHDAGKSADELFLQGVTFSDKRVHLLESISQRYGIDCDDGRFVVGCPLSSLQKAIWAVGQASSLAMVELLRHKPSSEDEALKIEVTQIVLDWGSDRKVRVGKDIPVVGKTSKHKFDFVCGEGFKSVAINILTPGTGALGRAQRYGFQDYDLRETYAAYKKLAVLSAPPMWSKPAKDLVHKIANKTVEQSPMTPEEIAVSLDELLEIAA